MLTPQPPEEDHAHIHVVGAHTTVGNLKLPFKEKYTPDEGSITSFLYAYESAIEEASNYQRIRHLPSCLSFIAQEIMVHHLMNRAT